MNFEIKWDEKSYSEFLKYLINLSDEKYREFNIKVVKDNTIKYLGVRSPGLRKISKIIAKNDYKGFIKFNNHEFYEEILIHGFIIGYAKISYEELVKMIKEFIPYMSNWAIVDIFVSKFKQIQDNKDTAFKEILNFIKSDNPWEIRLGLILLLSMYVEENYIDKILKTSAIVKSDHYYVKMGNAWLLSECYIKFPKQTTKLFKIKTLDPWTQNKAIQKVRESFRVIKEDKEFLNTFKIKKQPTFW